MDYALFIAGTGHFLLAMISGKFRFNKVKNFDWMFLIFFGFFMALFYWLQLLVYIVAASALFLQLWHIFLLLGAASMLLYVYSNLKKFGGASVSVLILFLLPVVLAVFLALYNSRLFYHNSLLIFSFATGSSLLFLLFRILRKIKKYFLFYSVLALTIILYSLSFLLLPQILSANQILSLSEDTYSIVVLFAQGMLIFVISFRMWMFVSLKQTKKTLFQRLFLRLSPVHSAFILILLIMICGWIATEIYGDQAKKEIQQHTVNAAEIHKMQILDEFELAEKTVKGMAGSHWITSALRMPSAENMLQANRVLDRYKHSLTAAACYVMDSTGKTILSSNRNEKKSFIGKNFSFRPYFKQAMAGKAGRYLAVGVSSGEKGMYASFPVKGSHGKVLGVLVMKRRLGSQSLISLDERLILFVLSPQGVIFLSSRPEYEKHTFFPLSKADRNRLIKSRQFGKSSFDPVFASNARANKYLILNGREFVSYMVPLDSSGWRIAVLGDLHQYRAYRFFAIILTFFIIFLITVFSFFFEHIRMIAQRAGQSELQLRTIFESMPGSILIIEPATLKLLDINIFFCRMLGEEKENILRSSLKNYFHSGYGAFKEDILRVKENEILPIKNYRFFKKDNSYMDVEGTCTAIRFEDELRIIVFLSDVTERNKALRIMRENERKFKNIFDHASDGIILLYNGKIYNANAKAAEMFATTPDDFIGSSPEDFLPEYQMDGARSHDQLMDHLAQALKGKHQKFNCQYLRKDRVMFDAGVSLSRVEVNGKLMIQVMIRDISEQKQLERSLQTARDNALEAAKAKAEFLANMSHEIRTPMNGVIGMLDLVSDTALDEEQKDYIETAKMSAESLLTIINDILDFSKIEAGKLTLESTETDLRKLIENVADTLAKSAHEKGLELICSVDEDIPAFVKTDAVRLRQVLLNLVNNAIKFTASGEVQLTAKLQYSEQKYSYVRFSVIDTGIGIAPDKQKKIFEAFQQADGSTTRKFGGTGLGLAISRQLIQLMGGQLELQSSEGKGSEFFFVLPLEGSGSRQEAVQTDATVSNASVLIIDDNKTNLKVLEKMVGNFGMQAYIADCGSRGLEILGSGKKIDLLLLDVRMPEMDGFNVLKKIKSGRKGGNLKIIVLSSSAGANDKEWFMKHGCTHFLNKPVKQKQLYQAIREALGRKERGEKTEKKRTKPAARKKQPAKKLHILLAEDNFINQKVAVRMLEIGGYEVSVANNGREAVEMFSTNGFDLILMDAQMPEMDGIEATRKIREMNKKKRSVPIIAMTAHALKGDRERFLNAGMDDYISKPVQQKELMALMDKYARKLSAEQAGKGIEQQKNKTTEEQS